MLAAGFMQRQAHITSSVHTLKLLLQCFGVKRMIKTLLHYCSTVLTCTDSLSKALSQQGIVECISFTLVVELCLNAL
jgi:hypothetical protein